jgi:transcriptional regulator GlxA family with amidase domain
MAEALMQQCFILLLRRRLRRAGGPPALAGLRHPGLADAVLAVLQNPAAPHSVESLAASAGMRRTLFAESFSRAFGQGPSEFVQQTRLRAAARLLTSTDLPVKVIAASVGYASRSQFSRAFTASHGVDPTRYRRGAAEGMADPGS